MSVRVTQPHHHRNAYCPSGQLILFRSNGEDGGMSMKHSASLVDLPKMQRTVEIKKKKPFEGMCTSRYAVMGAVIRVLAQ